MVGAGSAGLQQTALQGDTGEPSQAPAHEGSQHMVCISYIIYKEPQPFCKASSCSQSVWALVSAFADPASALDTVRFHHYQSPQTVFSCKFGRFRSK